MKRLAIVAVACASIAGNAMAGQSHGQHGGQGGRDGGWDSNAGVLVDVPWSAIMNANNPGPTYSHCREARHICFDRWGVDEPGYGRCMWRHHC